ncbi:putative Ca2+-binding EF-hand superfamily protein [uncultured Gammaproteobacteria bacterium]
MIGSMSGYGSSTAMSSMPRPDAATIKKMQEQFVKSADTSGDGKLDASELKTAFESRKSESSQSSGATTGTTGSLMGSQTGRFMTMMRESGGDSGGPGGSGPPPGPPPAGGPGGAGGAGGGKAPSATDLVKAGDTDGDGKLSADELTAAFESVRPKDEASSSTSATSSSSSTSTSTTSSTSFKAPSAADLIKAGDTDGDGLLSADELNSLFESKQAKNSASSSRSKPPSAEDLVKAGDSNGDGALTADELSAMFESQQSGQSQSSGSDSMPFWMKSGSSGRGGSAANQSGNGFGLLNSKTLSTLLQTQALAA